ncbi:hypothetical protein COCON_G00205160 [Conger conger]|uniref:Uncharacterized protein n=1 Tax=Conger conger TaxID=82655 RepID=A0A9Q1CZI0_CONCO|nr:hypothetical protein COCON_G00205160 [Conger conger]
MLVHQQWEAPVTTAPSLRLACRLGLIPSAPSCEPHLVNPLLPLCSALAPCPWALVPGRAAEHHLLNHLKRD